MLLSLIRRTARLLPATLAALVLPTLAPLSAAAQTKVTPQTETAPLATNLACTGTTQVFPIPDVGQTEHSAIITLGGASVGSTFASFVAQDLNGDSITISDVLEGSIPEPQVITASGYYPVLNLLVTCPATQTVTIFYSGTSSTPFTLFGNSLATATSKFWFNAAPANANIRSPGLIVTPFGSLSGTLDFAYKATGPSGSTVTVNCWDSAQIPMFQETVSLATTTTPQIFSLPSAPCPYVYVSYVSGGASATTFSLAETFLPPGFTGAPGAPSVNITSNTTTVVKGTPGTLSRIIIDTSAAGTIKIYDIAAAGCAGSPASGLRGTITLAGTEPPSSIFYDLEMTQGICIVTSASPDIIVSYQ